MTNLITGLIAAVLILFGLGALAESGVAMSNDQVLQRRQRRFGPPHRGC